MFFSSGSLHHLKTDRLDINERILTFGWGGVVWGRVKLHHSIPPFSLLDRVLESYCYNTTLTSLSMSSVQSFCFPKIIIVK